MKLNAFLLIPFSDLFVDEPCALQAIVLLLSDTDKSLLATIASQVEIYRILRQFGVKNATPSITFT